MSAAWTFPHCIVLTKVMDQKLAEDIHNSIYGLNQLLHEAGIKDICRILERILHSPDEISALYNAFASRLKDLSKKRRADTAFIHRCDWFRNFASQDGTRLDPKEINALAKITSCWELSDEQIEVLSACSIIWSKSPELFWYGESADDNLIRRCYNDLRTMEDVDPLRRRIVLMILAQNVEQEQDSLRTKGQRVRSRPRNRKVSEGRSRKRVLLPSAVRSLTKDLWPQLPPEKQSYIKKRLATDSLYGWKWRQVDRAEMVLSLQSAATKRFERHSWSELEREAMNQFVETLPQRRIQLLLRDAMKSIISYYSKSMGSNRACRASPVNRSQSPSGVIATTVPTSHTPSAIGEPMDQRTSEGCSPLATLSVHEQAVAQIQPPEALENIRSLSIDNHLQLLVSDVSAPDNPHPQTNTALWDSQARSGIMDMHQSHGLGEIANISQNRSPIGQGKGSQYQVADSRATFEAHPVLNPLPPFSDNSLSSSTTWDQIHPVLNPLPPFSDNSLSSSTTWDQIHPLCQFDTQERDWSSSYSDRIFETHIAQSNDLSQPVSNPLPPIGRIPEYAQSQWLLPENHPLLKDYSIVDSLSNPLPPFDSRSENFLFQ